MAGMFFDDGSFRFPAELTDISPVPDDCRRYYRYDSTRKRHVLLRHVEEMFGAVRAQIEELETALAEMPVKYEKEVAALNRAAIEDALHSALTAAGVAKPLARGAAAIMRDTYKLAVLESGGERYVAAETSYGVFAVDQLVEQFLESEDGLPFAAKPVNPEPGHFAGKLMH